MKKVLLTMALFVIASLSYAQVLKNNFLAGYKVGDKLEKAVYMDKTDPIKLDTWCRGFMPTPVEGYEGPLVGEELSYPGYHEGGLSIKFGNLPYGAKPISVYSMDKGKKFNGGTLYFSFLANFSQLEGNGIVDFVAFSPNYVGGSDRGIVCVGREGSNKIRFGVGLVRKRVEGTTVYDYNKTYLLVIKLDYEKNEASLFINPDLSGEEPKANIVTDGGEYVLEHPMRSVSFRNRYGYIGNVGNFRLSNSWAGVTAQ